MAPEQIELMTQAKSVSNCSHEKQRNNDQEVDTLEIMQYHQTYKCGKSKSSTEPEPSTPSSYMVGA